jgi:hypothetical protein
VFNPDQYAIRAASAVVESGSSWVEMTAETRTVQLGVSYDAP